MKKVKGLEWVRNHKLRLALFVVILGLLYSVIILAFFRTPKTSYWINDAIYGKTKYFHFRVGNDEWDKTLPIDVPRKLEDSYRLAIIELDEYGDFFSSEENLHRPSQLQCARDMLKDAISVDRRPLLLFLYVHGWRHDASKNDTDLAGFKALLENLAKNDWTKDFSICGVYVGWRGASIRQAGIFTMPAEILSFWSRKSVAEKIGKTPVSLALFELIDFARTPKTGQAHSRIVLAGHSLGAGILMNAISQALAYEYAKAKSAERPNAQSTVTLESPANLILLLNPALESVYLRQLRVSIRPKESSGYPWLVSLTSETDWITKWVFPLAQWLQGSRAREQPYLERDWSNYDSAEDEGERIPINVSQNEYVLNTPGNNPHMLDWRVVADRHPGGDENLADVVEYNMQYGTRNYFVLKGNGGKAEKEGKREKQWYGFFKEVRPKSEIHSLFWVARVDQKIMNGHGLPFGDGEGVRREQLIGMIMTLMNDGGVRYPTKGPEELKPPEM